VINEEQRPETRERVAVFFYSAIVFVAALAVRSFFVFELRNDSYLGNVRVSDSVAYFELAQQVVAGTAPFEPYWQAPLYPLLLAFFQSLFGESLQAAQSFHVFIGSLNCVLLFRLSDNLFGLRTAAVAAGIAVLYAPFWIFDVQPLPANLTTLLYLLLVLSYLRYRRSRAAAWLASAGLLLGAAILSHGLAIFTIPVFFYDIATGIREKHETSARCRAHLVLFLATTILAPGAVSVRNSLAAGAPVFVSYNAGINLYIGNHHDLEQTLARRAGYEWEELFRESRKLGITQPAALNEYFVRRAVDEWIASPLALSIATTKKLLLALSASEPKRNFPIYSLRESSWALYALLWELTAFGFVLFAFPGGLVLPLAVLGFGIVRRGGIGSRLPGGGTALPGWVALFHLVGMVVFFPTARYRVPALTLLLPYAAAMAVFLWDGLRYRAKPGARMRTRGALPAAAVVLLFVLVNPVASNVLRHSIRDRAEHHYYEARWAAQRLRLSETADLEAQLTARATEANRLDPTYPEPVELLAMYYLVRDPTRSVALFARLEELLPENPKIQKLLRDTREMRAPRS
jgi:4-amino-4-deoxy-L-arabinose transferase-like glycosyltransferase